MLKEAQSYKKILEIYDTLTKKQKELADYIITNFEEIIISPIGKLAGETGISEPTIIRFARMLGFPGYPELREDLLNFYKETVVPTQSLKKYITSNEEESIFNNILHSELLSLKEAVSTLDESVLNKAVDKLCSAKRIYTYGGGVAKSVTGFCSHKLYRFGLDVVEIKESGRYVFEKLHFADENDFVIIFKNNKPTKEFETIMTFLNDKNITSLLITDTRIPTMVRFASMYLFAKRVSFGAFHSQISTMFITNAILVRLAERLGDKAIKPIIELNNIRERYINMGAKS